MVSLTEGEGFKQMLEDDGWIIMICSVGGQMDFLSDTDLLLGGELKQVPKSQVWKDIIVLNHNGLM